MTPIDPMLSLALAMDTTPGGYALLLGSGVSTGAGILTGWGIVGDLVGRLARIKGEDPGPDPVAWYQNEFGEQPAYDTLIEELADTPTERRELLRHFFEATDGERESGLKVPTRAHHAIASLVATRHVRVIVTTNFDHLLETAIRERGIVPTVISTVDAAAAAVPLHYEPVTIVKIHGDYLDTRIRNTVRELAAYEKPLNGLLDRIFDDYGLVVCGWSAEWDDALRGAIERCPSRRFTTFWCAKGPLTAVAERLVEARRALVIPIEDADSFFEQLAGKVIALDDIGQPHPANAQIAVATAKRYLATADNRIRLHDLVMDEVTAIRARMSVDIPENAEPTADLFSRTVERLTAASANLCAVLVAGAYWGGESHRQLWLDVVERLNAIWAERKPGGFNEWIYLLNYPAQLAFYAAGVGAVARGDEESLCDLLLKPRLRSLSRDRLNPPLVLHAYAVIRNAWAREYLPGTEQSAYASSDFLRSAIQPSVRHTVPDQQAFDEAFDRFEFIVGLAYIGLKSSATELCNSGPLGGLGWRQDGSGREIYRQLTDEIDRADSNWLLLRRGLFGGSVDLLRKAKFVLMASGQAF